MTDSTFKTVRLPATRSDSDPARLAQAGTCPLRVVVRVKGEAGQAAVVGFASASLGRVESDSTVADGFTIPNEASETFVLAPNQVLLAIGNSDGVKVCVATSETAVGA